MPMLLDAIATAAAVAADTTGADAAKEASADPAASCRTSAVAAANPASEIGVVETAAIADADSFRGGTTKFCKSHVRFRQQDEPQAVVVDNIQGDQQQ